MGFNYYRIGLAGLFLVMFLSDIRAQTQSHVLSEKDTIRYRSVDSTIYYQKPERIIELYGQASVQYEDIELTAGYIRIHVDSQTLLAKASKDSDSTVSADNPENPILIQGSEKIYGQRIGYNMKTKRGKVFQGQSKMEDGFYHGREILSVDKKEIYLDQSHYSSCNLEPEKQHYYFQIRDIKVLPKDKILARHIVFYLNHVPYFYLPMQTGVSLQDTSGYFYLPKLPVFYFPILMFPIRRDRHSGLLMPKIGQEQIGGRNMYVIKETGYYWAINDYTDNLYRLNFYNSNNILMQNQFRYNLRYILSGTIDARYWYTNNSREWALEFQHSQELTPTTRISAGGNFTSSNSFYQQTSEEVENRINRVLNSNFLLNKRLGYGSLNLSLSRSENLDTKITHQQLPTFGFNLNSREVKGFYFSYSNKALYYTYEDTTRTQNRFGATHYASLSRTDKIKSYLRLNHSLNLNEVWFDKAYNADSTEKRFVRKINFSYSLTLGNTLYGVFAPSILGIKAIRHKIDPTIGFAFTPADRDSSTLYSSFPSISYYPNRIGSKSLTIRVSNLFQMKSQGKKSDTNQDKSPEEKRTDLFTMDFSTAYNFEAEDSKWSDLMTSFHMKPLQNINISISSIHDLYNEDRTHAFQGLPRMKNLSLSNSNSYSLSLATVPVWGLFLPIPLLVSKAKSSSNTPSVTTPDTTTTPISGTTGLFSRDWHGEFTPEFKISIQHNFTLNQAMLIYGKTTTRIHWINLNANWNLSQRWKIEYQSRIDLTQWDILGHTIILKNDLHCWEFMFRYRNETGYKGFYWIVNIKAIPDIKVEQIRRTQ